MSKKSKKENIQAVLDACIQLEVTKGHLQWTFMDLSRVSGVTRSLIYYYFSDSKKTLLRKAVQQMADRFLNIRFQNIQRMQQGEIFALVRSTRQGLRKNPYILQFYAKHRLEGTEFNQIFEKAEQNFYENMAHTLPQRWKDLSRVLWALIFGLAIQPGLSEKDLKLAERIIQRAWRKPHKKI